MKVSRQKSVMQEFGSIIQRTVLMKTFMEVQFGYCQLVWKCHGRVLNKKINHLHERSLRIVYRDSISSFQELLQKEHSFTIYHRNIQSLAIKLYKIENLSNEIMSSIFPLRLTKYNSRAQSDFLRNSVNSSKYGLNSIRFFASKVCQMVPMKIRNLKSLEKTKLENGNLMDVTVDSAKTLCLI